MKALFTGAGHGAGEAKKHRCSAHCSKQGCHPHELQLLFHDAPQLESAKVLALRLALSELPHWHF
jgi:hypothetical protein